MSGLASMNRYHQFDWQAGAPQPGELDYLTGCELRRKASAQPWYADTRIKSVTDSTYSYARARR